ncbi:MAG: MotA/TolQ/ExbB proton channel family protein [Fibrobacterales bacterium]
MGIILKGFGLDQSGWGFMWAIAIMGGLALGLAVERFYYIVIKSGKGRKEFMKNIAGMLKSEKVSEAINYAKTSELPLAKCIFAVLSNKDRGEKGMTKALDEVFLTEAPRVNRYLSVLMTLANVATLVGLIGTIFGLIMAFDAVANLPAAERPTALANGIAVAMNTTFCGLFVAIPLMFAQGYYSMESERIIEEMEEKSLKVINLFDK